MSGRKQRRRFTGEQKASIPRRHLLEQVPVSDLCEEHGLKANTTIFASSDSDSLLAKAAVILLLGAVHEVRG